MIWRCGCENVMPYVWTEALDREERRAWTWRAYALDLYIDNHATTGTLFFSRREVSKTSGSYSRRVCFEAFHCRVKHDFKYLANEMVASHASYSKRCTPSGRHVNSVLCKQVYILYFVFLLPKSFNPDIPIRSLGV